MPNEAEDLERLLSSYAPFLILAPPRSSSTALARALFSHSSVTSYIHEPCDLLAHHGASPDSVVERLTKGGLRPGGLIKEMTFQLDHEEIRPVFLRCCRSPIILLVRNPRLSIASRIRMVLKDMLATGNPPDAAKQIIASALQNRDFSRCDDLLDPSLFPIRFTGWQSLDRQLEWCRKHGVDYVVVDAGHMRSEPEACLRLLCSRLDLSFESPMVEWDRGKHVQLGGLDEQGEWYKRVLSSRHILPPTELPLPLDRFPARFRRHVPIAMGIYRKALEDGHRLALS